MKRAQGFQSVAGWRSGFTVVELLVVIAILGILIGLLLPAVQAARENGRRVQCVNNLRQVGVAMLSHENSIRHFPTGGWGFLWVGDPRRGSGEMQPGGWVFAVLPYLEQGLIHDLALGAVSDAERRSKLAEMSQQGLPLFHCPSRRPVGPYPTELQAFNTEFVNRVAKSDYAANAGSVLFDVGTGPLTLGEGDTRWYAWPNYDATGICFLRSRVKVADIRDGTSKTILAGEKNLPSKRYRTGDDLGDDQSMCSGEDFDTRRGANVGLFPVNDRSLVNSEARFGSAHANGCHLLLCDGAVRLASYAIGPYVFEHLGNRNDGEGVSDW